MESAVAEALKVSREKLKAQIQAGTINSGATGTANVCVEYRKAGKRYVTLGNMGDAKTYIRNRTTGEIREVSYDHSLVANLKRAGQLTEIEAFTDSARNFVYRFVDSNINNLAGFLASEIDNLKVAADVKTIELKDEEDVVMASDGATDNIHPEHLRSLSQKFATSKASGEDFAQYIHDVAKSIATKPADKSVDWAKPDDISIWSSVAKTLQGASIQLLPDYSASIDEMTALMSRAGSRFDSMKKVRVPIFDNQTGARLTAEQQVEILASRGVKVPQFSKADGHRLNPEEQIAAFEEKRFRIPKFDSATGKRMSDSELVAYFESLGFKPKKYDSKLGLPIPSAQQLRQILDLLK